MDDYAREMMDLKTLVTRTLEKKGVLAKIRAELRASVFEAIEEEDRVIQNEESGLPPALLGSCNDRAKQLHASPTGRLLTALVSEYLDWAQLGHTLKVYLPECNLEKDFWKAELREFSSKNGYEMCRNSENRPILLDVLEGFLKSEQPQHLVQTRGGRKIGISDADSTLNTETRNTRRPSSSSSSSIAGGLPPLVRPGQASQSSDRRLGPRKEDYNWRYDNDLSEDVLRASSALENIHLDRKARNLSTSWRHVGDGEGDGK
ncbi:Protein TONNEAU 1b [Apostasia shenzhenica]|uniref:Protein TONNEAU 1b n=1 Tax=Apostasia shenzhenica TaxID=1088818 RepID=A0A2I0B663_9ASPA|nr:Protein TONNEAU 1b [Apostasia shenzhenica]